nr:MAG TPA: hypothetical protein [Caudoviricetes sp.]
MKCFVFKNFSTFSKLLTFAKNDKFIHKPTLHINSFHTLH